MSVPASLPPSLQPAGALAPLSRRQWQCLQALRTLWKSAACPPTREELGVALGVRAQTADFHLRALARKGFVELGRNAREIRLLAPARELLGPLRGPSRGAERVSGGSELSAENPQRQIPILGNVAAGLPILALENQQGSLPVALSSTADFALRVQGDSMIDAGILEGDVVLVQQTTEAPAGSIVVALVGEGESLEATVKSYMPERRRVRLCAANPAYEDLVLTPDTPFSLAGRVVGLWRDAHHSFHWKPQSQN